jgi:hypothetical protein
LLPDLLSLSLACDDCLALAVAPVAVTYEVQCVDELGRRVRRREEACFSKNGLLQSARILE